MHRTIRLTLTSLLALSLGACGGSKPIRYYTLQVPPAPTLTSSTSSISLAVASINGAQIFQNEPIAYRIGVNEIGTYQFSQWAEPPVNLVRRRLIRMLRASGDYQSVTELGTNSGGQFLLRGRLYDFEEVDSGSSIAALVSLEFDLYDRKSGRVVWSHFYSQSEPVSVKEISAIVTALDLNLDRGLKEVAAGLDQYFSTTLGKKS
jgi:ABC-type uncharacterized transport system auxiliary subunit